MFSECNPKLVGWAIRSYLFISKRLPQNSQLGAASEGPGIGIVSQSRFDFRNFRICNVERYGCGDIQGLVQMLMQSHAATVILSGSLRVLLCLGRLEIARRCRSSSTVFFATAFRLPILVLIRNQYTTLRCSMVRTHTNESPTIRTLRLWPFRSLAKNPLTDIGRTVKQYNTLVLAANQESYNLNVHKSDFTQVHEGTDVLIVYLSPYVADIDRLNSAKEPQDGSASARLLFNSQHWSNVPLGLWRSCWHRQRR